MSGRCRFGACAILASLGASSGCQSPAFKRVEATLSADVAAVDSFVTKTVKAAAEHLPPGTYQVRVDGPAGIGASVSYTKPPESDK